MVWQRGVLNTMAMNLNVDKAMVWRIVKLFREIAQVEK